MSKRLVVVSVGIVAFASLAFAGLAERERKRELEPKIASASEAVTATCGCSPGVQIDWETFKTVESMYTLDFLMSSYQEISERFCKADAEAKAGFCSSVKGVAVKWTADPPSARCSGGTCEFLVSSESYLTSPFQEFLEKL